MRPIDGPSAFGGDRRRFLSLLWLTAIQDFRLQYRASALGYVWTLGRPLLLFAVLYVVFTHILHFGRDIPHYPVLLLMNIMLFQFPEHWIAQLGQRIKNVHLKEFSKNATDHSLESFRTLLDGTTNWPAVLDAFDAIGYRGYLTFEYFHPFAHYPEALIYQTSDALDRMLGKKT